MSASSVGAEKHTTILRGNGASKATIGASRTWRRVLDALADSSWTPTATKHDSLSLDVQEGGLKCSATQEELHDLGFVSHALRLPRGR